MASAPVLLGGVALSQLGNVGPELGQGYIIDSFLVVVLGGVGQLAGRAAAFGLGIFNKILEPQMGAVLGKILITVMIILFIQKRPQGLFALKGGLSTNEPTNHLNAGAARAAASALAGILLVLGLLSMPFWRCCRPPIRWRCRAGC